MKRLVLTIVLLFLASPVLAGIRQQERRATCDKCADEHVLVPSLAFYAGLGTTEDRWGEGNTTRLAAYFDYPVIEKISLLASWDHEHTEWDALKTKWCFPDADETTGSDIFSVGFRLNFK